MHGEIRNHEYIASGFNSTCEYTLKQGIPGNAGAKGEQGDQGAQGSTGSSGPQGLKGQKGRPVSD